MTNHSRIPLTVTKAGVETRLDTLASWVETKDGLIGGLSRQVGSSIEVAGRNGSMYMRGRHREEKSLVLSIWVNNTDADGLTPSYQVFRKNLDEINKLFDTTNSQITLTEYIGGMYGENNARKAVVEVRSQYVPDYTDGFEHAKVKIECVINSGVWSDVGTYTFTSASGASVLNTTMTLTPLIGGTAEIEDAFIVIDGPVNSPKLVDPTNDSVLQLQTNVPAGQQWVVNCATYESYMGTNIEQNPRQGTNMARYTFTSGPLAPSMFPIHPNASVTFNGSSGGTTTRLRITAGRKYH